MATADPLESRVRRLALENALGHPEGARPGPIVARLLATDPSLRPRSREVGALVGRTIEAVNRLPRAELESELAALGGPEAEGHREERAGSGELPPLPAAEPGKVVLRLAPFPSGALHLGNSRMLFINDAYRRRYDGQLYLVFDDTIGSEEKRVDLEIFDLIRSDLELANIPVDKTFYKSDRVPLYYPWARRVIDADGAYVCTCPAELLRENRKNGIACAHRAQDRSTTIEEWERMLGGSYGEGEAVLRLRTDPKDPDPAFRDRVLFRISDLDHPRVGHKYRVWPLLEISWAVDDIELGLTHVLRGKDLVIEDKMQEFIWDLLGISRRPRFFHWGLLRVREAKLSKSKSYAEVKSGVFDGWGDPRTWSLQSLERRGIRLEAVRRFTMSFGLSLSDIEVPAETLYAENRQLIDATTMRRSFVPDPARVRVDGYPEGLHTMTLPNHPERAELGERTVRAGPDFYLPRSELLRHAGTEIRLKDLINVQLPATIPEPNGDPIPLTFTSRENKRLPRIQWVGAPGSVAVDVLSIEGTHLIGRGEAGLAVATPGSTFQFERYGFVRVAAGWATGTEPVAVSFGHP